MNLLRDILIVRLKKDTVDTYHEGRGKVRYKAFCEAF